MSVRFTPSAEGVQVRVPRRELAVLRAVPGFLSTLGNEPDHVAGRRNPPVYPDDPASDRDFHRLVSADVDDARERDRRMLELVVDRLDAAGETELSLEEAEGTLRAVGAARIALAARSGLLDLPHLPPEPETPQEMLVAFLGVIQEDLVAALSTGLTEPA